jgi:hypothetical protein
MILNHVFINIYYMSTPSTRRSSRLSTQPKRFEEEVFETHDPYDRCLGGYIWPSLHKDQLIRLPQRNTNELIAEQALVRKIESTSGNKEHTKEGYVLDDFVVEDDD